MFRSLENTRHNCPGGALLTPRGHRRPQGLVAAAWVLLLAAHPGAAQEDRKQTRPAKVRVDVAVEKVRVQDGDTVVLDWGQGDRETVRILGIDTPETQNIEHNLPYDQPFGREAAGFARGAFATASSVQLLRAEQTDPYGRTLGYLFVNGKNYSALIVSARLAAESVSHYGDNGFPQESAAVLEAARAAGPLPFEPPHEFRRRMREVTEYLRASGALPARN